MKNSRNVDCIGFVEYRSVAKGLAAADKMLKSSDVELIYASVLCPGKYVAMVAGDISSVKEAEKSVHVTDQEYLLSSVVLTDIDQKVFPALTATSHFEELDTLGVLEVIDTVSAVLAADKIAKSARVDLLEIRLARGLGGKGLVFFNGELANVEEGMQNALDAISDRGTLISYSIIANACPEILL